MSGPHHIVVPAGKVIPHNPATFADAAEPLAPTGKVIQHHPPTFATADPLAVLVGQVNDVLDAAGLGRPAGPAEEVLAVLPLAEDADLADVLAALRAQEADLTRAAAWPAEGEPDVPAGGPGFESGGTGIIAVAFGKVIPH